MRSICFIEICFIQILQKEGSVKRPPLSGRSVDPVGNGRLGEEAQKSLI